MASMNVPNPDLDAVAAHAASAGDEPVVMVNLMKFKGAEHAQRFMAESRERTGPFVAALGATVLYTGLAGPEFC